MRHGFGSMHGYFAGNDGGLTVIVFVLLIALLALILLIVHASTKKNHPEHDRLMNILKGKYAEKVIGTDEFRERNMVLEDEYWIDAIDPEMMTLKERYARCEIDSREYVKRREELGEMRDKSSSASFNERPA
jgi:uncharacterized membrane protein